MTRTLFSLMLIGTLAGCMTPAERAEQANREVEQMIQTYGPACEKLGFKPNTDPWRNCVLHLSSEDHRQRPVTTSCFRYPGGLNCSSF